MRISDLLNESALSNSGTLRRGSRGDAVRELQQKLGITADGIFGPQTDRAVRSFQQEQGIQVDGIVGPQTKEKLGAGSSVSPTVSTSGSAGNTETPSGPGRNQSSGWTTIEVGGTAYEVGNDYVRSGGVYATFSGNSARAYCKQMNWIMPTAAICKAIAQKAKIIPMPTQDQWNKNSKFYPNGDAAYHTQQIFKLTGGGFPSGLVAGHKKDVVQGNGSGTCLWGGAKRGGGFWQGGGCPHGGGHQDYSQGLRPVRLLKGQKSS